MTNALNWFEIPVSDFERAITFYSTIFGVELIRMEAPDGFSMAMFPAEEGVSGALVQGEGYVPSAEGSIVYLNGGEDLNNVLNRIGGAGGQAASPKIDIGENGFYAFLIDSEGNKVGLHSMG